MTITVTIGGVSMSGDAHFVDEGSINHVNAIGQRDTFSCRVVSKDGTYTPAIGAAVSVSDDSGVRFGGSVREKTVSQFGVGVVTEIQCASWEQIMDRRLVGQATSNPGETCGEFFQRIFDGYLGAEGLTATIVAAGPVIDPPMSLDWPTVREAFDLIASQASDDTDTYMWDCTAAKVTRFYKQSSFAAPMSVTDASTDVMRPITINQSFGGSGVGYANKAFVRMSSLITDERTNTFSPDGATRAFSFEIPIATSPAITLDGVSQTVGIRDIDTGKQWYWQDGSAEVSQDPGETIPSNTSTLVVVARGYQSTVVDAGDIADEVTARSIAEDNSGWYMVLLESGSAGARADAVSFGQAALAKYANGVPRAVEYVTTTNGIRAGQHQSITLSGFGESVSSTFIIESVTLFQAGTEYGFRVRAVNGALAGGWLQKIRALAGKAGGVTSVGGTVVTSDSAPASNVTIGTVTVEAAQYSPTGAGKGRRMAARRPLSIAYTPPSPVGAFKGVYVEVVLPDDAATAPDMSGSTSLAATVSLGATTPARFGPFADSDAAGAVRVLIDEPNWRTASSVNGRVRLISYSAEVINDPATAPSATFTLEPPATAKPGSATAYAQNSTSVSIPATYADGTANPYVETTTGTSKTHLLVHQDAPDDPLFAGVAWRISDDPDGLEIITASGPQKEADFELVFSTPTTVATYYVWACGVDADGNVNPIVPGATPMVEVSLGTTGGTVDLGAALSGTYSGDHFTLAGGEFKIAGVPLGAYIATDIASHLAVTSGVLGVAASGITSGLVAAYAINNTHFDRVGVNKIAIIDADIVNLAAAKITAGTLAAGVIYAGSIAATQIAAGTLAVGVVYAGAINASQITAGTIGAGIVYAGTINASQINAGTISVALTLTAPTIQCTSTSGGFSKVALIQTGAYSAPISVTNYNGGVQQSQAILDSISLKVSDGFGYAYYQRDGVYVDGQKIVGGQETGPGNPSFGTLANAQSWCQALLNALRNHGMVS